MVELRIPAFLEVSHSNLSGDGPAIVIARVEDHRDLIARDAAGKDHLGASLPVAAVSIHVVDDGICRCCLAQLGETLSIPNFVGLGEIGSAHAEPQSLIRTASSSLC